MKFPIITFIVALLIAQPASARLGETYQECVARYGALREKKGSPKNPQFMFEKEGIRIGINFLNDKAAQISFSKQGSFLDSEVQRLLDANSGGSKWSYDAAETQRKLAPDIYNKQEYFVREDREAVAEHLTFQTQADFVIIASTEYMKAISSKHLQGF